MVATEDLTTFGSFQSPVTYSKITQIVAVDQNRHGHGGTPTLAQGGPGYNNAVVHLKSKRNHGLNFYIEFYGH